ncbi:XdhC family protein [Streptomyces iconiensis]|uniref:XdhC family protein n=1 Tax=Streptomyces iconiensis TaxID=1384038 RepID=A0ABT7A6D8_9ACTN|nr:XdhC/CoxI family protein [Streptomyces iconiensis]MDJ1136910.1 XdhC family protein [Streptomyces iconiensis]
MLDIAAALHTWCGEGRDFAVATVVGVGGSAPRQPGAALAVDTAGEAVGSVSGGCVEGAVYELCQQALESGESARETFGYSDEDAFAVGLTCGGIIDILVTPVRADSPLRAVFARAVATAATGGTAALVRIVDGPPELLGAALHLGPETGSAPTPGSVPKTDADAAEGPYAGEPPYAGGGVAGTLGGSPELDATAVAEGRALLAAGRTTTVTVGADGRLCGQPVTLLVESSVPPPRMLVFGAIDFAAALVRVGKFLGYHVTVCDARAVFATDRRFPEADEIVVDWPHRYLDTQRPDARTVVCVLTHDAKFDVPLLERALRMPLAYVGAMGSRRTHLDRLARLREAGVADAELAALRSPIGLDLGARTPEETALSIASEIVAARHGGSGAPLTGAHTPIHHEPGTVGVG